MSWVAVSPTGFEFVFEEKPKRKFYGEHCRFCLWDSADRNYVNLPKGSIKKLIGRDLTWEDEPVELRKN